MIYPNQARLLDIIQEAGLKRQGLVASCIFPEVEVPSCNFQFIDWAPSYGNLRPTNDLVGCYSTPHRIDPSAFEYILGKTKEHALDIVLKECCVSACTPDGRLPFNIDAKKSQEITDLLLINREVSAITKATNESAYTSPTNQDPGNAAQTTSEGIMFSLAASNLTDPDFDLLGYFQAIQSKALLTGTRNKLILDLATLYKILRHPSLKNGGCAIPPMAAQAEVASLLGVSEVCIADTAINNALTGVSMGRLWGSYILLTRSVDYVQPDSFTRGFGFSAYTKPITNRIYFDNHIGSDGGNVQVVSHDFTEVIADIKAGTLIKLT